MWLNFGKNKKMKITQTLRRPANWQDFESLCLLLWREEWKSEDLKKNGRNGQAQNGVDISGHRDGEGEFSGIQCKCKPGNKGLAMDEIDEEINNAKAFKPALRRLVFATTADKDATIEEYVRLKDDENRKKGLFSIDIKSWQDIIDLLERNKSVLNIYLDIVAEDYAVAVTFEDGAFETTIHPQYSKIYYLKPAPKGQPRKIASTNDAVRRLALGGLATQLEHITALAEAYSKPVIASPRIVRGSVETNHAFCPLKFMVANQGRTPIDDFKILFFFDNPNVIGIEDYTEKETEHILLSADRIDVWFKLADGSCVAVEVKSHKSTEADILRGIFQCVKYKSIMDAEDKVHRSEASNSSILVLGGTLSEHNKYYSDMLGVTVIDNVKIVK